MTISLCANSMASHLEAVSQSSPEVDSVTLAHQDVACEADDQPKVNGLNGTEKTKPIQEVNNVNSFAGPAPKLKELVVSA